MEAQLAAVDEVSEYLNNHGIKFFIIGGIANAIWGQPRATQDADFKIIVGRRLISELVALLGQKFKFRVADPLAFAQRTYVLPFYASNQIPVDVGLGFLPYEEQAVEHAVSIHHQGVDFLVCSAEDLIIQKAVSEREKDWSDIEGVLIRQGARLDQDYINEWLQQFAEALDRPDILERYHELRNRTGKD